MNKKITKPDLKTYLNIHDYLKDLYEFRKGTEPGFSYEVWAYELGLSNRSFLRQIIVGRRALTNQTSKVICDHLNLDSVEREYFNLLVLYSKARTAEDRNLYGRRLRQLIRLDYAQDEMKDSAKFVLKSLYPRLQTLLSFNDINKTVESLAHLLRLPVVEVAEALAELEGMDLVEKQISDKVQWQAKTKSFKVPEQLGSEVLINYHRQCLNESLQAFSRPASERRYRSIMVAMSEEEFADYLKDLEIFVKQSLGKFDRDDFHGRKLFQLNFNLHAVTEEGASELPTL
ncbi:TIGR02147 family protein [Bdellovibrio sp. HCB337]|uniref:TIGR02147 family protein n=1 Tax=Bdellovibrio sp. HCB337 TaxID=3394358 RepID=UPI0039A69056